MIALTRFPFAALLSNRLNILLPACLLAFAGCSRSNSSTEVASKALSTAWDDFRSGDFDRAVELFEQVRAQTREGSETNLMAIYGLGTVWDLRRPNEDRQRAADDYQMVVNLAPRSDLAAWSLYALARMKHLPPVGEEPDYPAVRAAYQVVIDRFPGHPAAEEAFLYQQAAWLETMSKPDAQTAKTALENYLRAHPASKYRSSVCGLLAEACRTLGEERERLDFSIQALDSMEFDPTDPSRDKAGAYWSIATIAEFRVGDFDTARAYYNRLIQEYPTDQRVFLARLALGRMDEMEKEIRAESANAAPAAIIR